MNDPSTPPDERPLPGAHVGLDMVLLELCELAAETDSPSLSYLAALLAALRVLLHDASGPEAVEHALAFVQRLAVEHAESGSLRESLAAGAAEAGTPLHLRLLGLYVDPFTGRLRSAVGPDAKWRMVH